LSLELLVTLVYSCIFIVLLVIDLEHQLILNKVVYPAAAVALVIDFLAPKPGIISGAIGGGVGLVLFLIPALVYPGGIGWGDVKMAALIGLVTGFPLTLVALLLAVILGALVAGLLLALKIKKRKEAIPFAPFLSVATIITLLWGSNILTWYLGLFR
jgi:prepilin signal peptidase PulO-like enzyme (type II secretory pathway)